MLKGTETFKLLEDGILAKGSTVVITALTEYDRGPIVIEDAYIRKARPFEVEEDWVVVVIDGETIAATWLDSVEKPKDQQP